MNKRTDNLAEHFQLLTNVLITAVEGGVGYWASCSDYNYSNPDPDNRGAVLYELEEGDGAEALHVTLHTIEVGMERIVRKDCPVCSNIWKIVACVWEDPSGDEVGDVDAEVADCIVQAGLFGEVVYG